MSAVNGLDARCRPPGEAVRVTTAHRWRRDRRDVGDPRDEYCIVWPGFVIDEGRHPEF
jgi:hypothetical protein